MQSKIFGISWWKILGPIIMLYVIIGGLSTPLNPGISDISTNQLIPGDNKILVTGYNTYWSKEPISAWIKIDKDHVISANSVASISDNQIEVSFTMPDHIDLPAKSIDFTLLVYNAASGPAILPSGFYYKNDRLISSDTTAVSWLTTFDGLKFEKPKGIRFPYRSILNETIRNTFFHVAIWMSMFGLLFASLYHAIQYLRTKEEDHDKKSYAFTVVAILYGFMGLATGSLWARFTWNTWWTNDVKLNMAAISMLIYVAYLILRSSMTDHDKRARVSAVYNIFSLIAIIPLLIILPRLNASLHPGNGGNPALGGEDLDHTLRLFFYPSIIALILIGTWMAEMTYRYEKLHDKVLSEE